MLPYGLVAHSGRWYLTGVDPDAGDAEVRTFRLDRIAAMAVRPGSFAAPAEFDPVAAVLDSLARAPWRHEVALRVRAAVPHVRRHLPASVATLSEEPEGWVRVRIRAERLEWIPPVLAALDSPFVIEEPAELRALVRALARRLDEHAAAGPGSGPGRDMP